MNWSEIRLHTTNEAIEPITNLLHEMGISGVVIVDPEDFKKEKQSKFGEIYELDHSEYPSEGVYIKFYLPTDSQTKEQVTSLMNAINNLATYQIDLGHNQIHIRELKEKDWANAWKKYYHTIQITDRITINPMWIDYVPKSTDEIVIKLDPGMAFGTGTHPTTNLSIKALEKYINLKDQMIDVGSGSGILSITAAKLGAKHVYSYDLDEVAVKSTIQNATLNNVQEQVKARKNDLLKNIHIPVHLIVSNILAEIIVQFVDDAWNNLIDHGIFITSGIIENKKDLVKDHLQKTGFAILEIQEQDGWVCIVGQKIT